ncbi:MAG: hypothetical protein AUF74_00080 [Thaumarchaeota archaeon 13_1_20CM_2_38_5]|nr:MAG: hypothetical protein AUF74_00080 [Thaumarchaeota archaeon 13_1_20CM_2_38_5]
MQIVLKPKTIKRLQEISGKPITKGGDKVINEVCDKLQDLEEKQETPSCWVDDDKTEKQGEER